jgi:phosphatidylserine decarboxylase
LFSVAPYTVRQVPDLFARNERVISIFDSPIGPFAQVLVGAMLVGSMETVWAGQVTPSNSRSIRSLDYAEQKLKLARGQEMGRFNMGSTVILILPHGVIRDSLGWQPGAALRMGQALAHLNQ